MFYSKAVPAILISVTVACGGGSDAGGSASQGSDAATRRAMSAADLPDPCGLVTDGEISDLLWRGMEANQRDAMQARNAQHVITKRVENIETPAGRTCHVQYRRVAGDTTWSEGDFRLRTLARQTFEIFAGASSSKDPIPGVGDQAFYMSNAAYGRRGDVGVEVVDFSSKELEIELLKNAVARLP
jgi:hypothetical protein